MDDMQRLTERRNGDLTPNKARPAVDTSEDQDNEKAWSGLTQSRQKAHKDSASMDDYVTVAQLFPDLERDDSAITTSPPTPDSQYRRPTHMISSGSPIMNNRRTSTYEPWQPSRWVPPPQTSDPRPIKSKLPSWTDGDSCFQSLSSRSGPWNSEFSLEETASTYPTPSSQDDSKEDLEQKLEAELSQRKSNLKQLEKEIMEWGEEARKVEVELGVKNAEGGRKEEEAKEEAQRKDEELRKEELRHSFRDKPYQSSQSHRAPSPTTLARSSSSTTPIIHTAPDSSILVDPKSSACRRSISHTFSPHEIVSLIGVIFTIKAEINVIRDLREDGAQTFIDVVHGVRPHFIYFRGSF